MKPILQWLEKAKEQGYEWADAAIRNCDPDAATVMKENLVYALAGAFSWMNSPEGKDFWYGVHESLRSDEEMDGFPSTITPVSPISLECLIEDLGKLNSALENLEYNETLKEPYRTRVYEATKASYEEQLAEVKAKIAKSLGIEPIKERKLIGWVATDQNGIIWRRDNSLIKDNGYWERKLEERLSPIQAMSLCGRVPKWSDEEPIPVYE